jgi:hypothetical protein
MRLPRKNVLNFHRLFHRLQLALKSSVYNILVKRRQAEEVLKAGIPGHFFLSAICR